MYSALYVLRSYSYHTNQQIPDSQFLRVAQIQSWRYRFFRLLEQYGVCTVVVVHTVRRTCHSIRTRDCPDMIMIR